MTRRVVLLTALLCAVGVAGQAHAARLTAQQLVELGAFDGLALSHDGRSLLATATGAGRPATVKIDVKTGALQRAPASEKAEFAVDWFPDDARILISRNEGDSEATHLFVRDQHGKDRDLTPAKGAQGKFQGWAKDGKSFFVSTNERDPAAIDLYEYDTTTIERRLRFRGDGYVMGRTQRAAISAGKDLIAVEKVLGFADSEVHVIDMASGRTVASIPSQQSTNIPLFFEAGGKALYYISDAGGEHVVLRRFSLVDRQDRVELAVAGASIHLALPLPDGRMVVVYDRDGRSFIRLHGPRGDTDIAIPAGLLHPVSITRDGRYAAFTLQSPYAPSSLYVIDLAGKGSLRQLHVAGAPTLAGVDLPEVRADSFTSSDGLRIPVIAYRPPTGVQLRGALLWVHGGPSGQSAFEFNPMLLYLAANGYAVYAVNHRGSSGYGKNFQHLDDLKQGEGNVRDLIEARQAMIDAGLSPDGRVAIMGGSFGGFLTLSAAIQAPDAWSAVIDLFGPTNWDRTMQVMPASWAARRIGFLKKIGDPAPDGGAYLRSISPLFRAAEIRAPLLVLQGTDDLRVVKQESDDLVAAVEAAGRKVDYVVLAGEGHGWPMQRDNQLTTLARISGFLDLHAAAR
ncbi:alpha/beta fold hydrolase [Roseiterribacter gracilis]|uniref:Acyl-peptide hydrolase n=1 Tax=Roseiterribacter gracilis TaxID=2812848 RepID=A0A8S8XB75_9PROT|nr:peptidase S9 [Rhodospirillales bacterium TMPK1]